MAIIQTSLSAILLVATIGMALVAYRNLKAIDSPRLVVKHVSEKYIGTGDKHHYIKATVKNFGSGIALKTYLIVKDSNNQYYQSKPLVILRNEEENELLVDIDVKEEVKDAIVITQDFFKFIYKVNVDTSFDNSHLHRMADPVKKVLKFGCSEFRIKYWMRKAKQQKNTYSDVVKREHKAKTEELSKKFGK